MMVKINKQTASLATMLVLFGLIGEGASAQSGLGGMYGGQPSGAQGVIEDEKFPADKPGTKPGVDLTADEIRVQNKYKGRIARDKYLIAKGARMMKAGPTGKDYKKGKVFRETGEKDLAELEANNPFAKPENPDRIMKGKFEKKEL